MKKTETLLYSLQNIQLKLLGKCVIVITTYDDGSISFGTYNTPPRIWVFRPDMSEGEVDKMFVEIQTYLGLQD